MPDNIQTKLLDVIAKSWTDDEYRQRLIKDPGTVLAEDGITAPPGANIRVVEHQPNDIYLFLPPRPQAEINVRNVASLAAAGAGLTVAATQPQSALLTIHSAVRLTDALTRSQASPLTDHLTRAQTAYLTDALTRSQASPLTDHLTRAQTAYLTDALTRSQASPLTDNLTRAQTAYLTDALTRSQASPLTEPHTAPLTVAAAAAPLTEPRTAPLTVQGTARLTEPQPASALLTVAPKGPTPEGSGGNG